MTNFEGERYADKMWALYEKGAALWDYLYQLESRAYKRYSKAGFAEDLKIASTYSEVMIGISHARRVFLSEYINASR